jgi:hypothetical protein
MLANNLVAGGMDDIVFNSFNVRSNSQFSQGSRHFIFLLSGMDAIEVGHAKTARWIR